jgi:hypothetical protein
LTAKAKARPEQASLLPRHRVQPVICRELDSTHSANARVAAVVAEVAGAAIHVAGTTPTHRRQARATGAIAGAALRGRRAGGRAVTAAAAVAASAGLAAAAGPGCTAGAPTAGGARAAVHQAVARLRAAWPEVGTGGAFGIAAHPLPGFTDLGARALRAGGTRRAHVANTGGCGVRATRALAAETGHTRARAAQIACTSRQAFGGRSTGAGPAVDGLAAQLLRPTTPRAQAFASGSAAPSLALLVMAASGERASGRWQCERPKHGNGRREAGQVTPGAVGEKSGGKPIESMRIHGTLQSGWRRRSERARSLSGIGHIGCSACRDFRVRA